MPPSKRPSSGSGTRSPLARLREACLALPDTVETISHGAPTFWVRGKRTFATFADGRTHHGNGRDAVWCKSTLDNQSLLVANEPRHVFIPPYVGYQGWIGLWLDGRVRWRLVEALLADAHRLARGAFTPPRAARSARTAR